MIINVYLASGLCLLVSVIAHAPKSETKTETKSDSKLESRPGPKSEMCKKKRLQVKAFLSRMAKKAASEGAPLPPDFPLDELVAELMLVLKPKECQAAWRGRAGRGPRGYRLQHKWDKQHRALLHGPLDEVPGDGQVFFRSRRGLQHRVHRRHRRAAPGQYYTGGSVGGTSSYGMDPYSSYGSFGGYGGFGGGGSSMSGLMGFMNMFGEGGAGGGAAKPKRELTEQELMWKNFDMVYKMTKMQRYMQKKQLMSAPAAEKSMGRAPTTDGMFGDRYYGFSGRTRREAVSEAPTKLSRRKRNIYSSSGPSAGGSAMRNVVAGQSGLFGQIQNTKPQAIYTAQSAPLPAAAAPSPVANVAASSTRSFGPPARAANVYSNAAPAHNAYAYQQANAAAAASQAAPIYSPPPMAPTASAPVAAPQSPQIQAMAAAPAVPAAPAASAAPAAAMAPAAGSAAPAVPVRQYASSLRSSGIYRPAVRTALASPASRPAADPASENTITKAEKLAHINRVRKYREYALRRNRMNMKRLQMEKQKMQKMQQMKQMQQMMMMMSMFGGERPEHPAPTPMSIMMGNARDPATGKKIDAGDFFAMNMQNNFHYAMTGRMLPPGKEGNDFVQMMAPMWAMNKMKSRMAMMPGSRRNTFDPRDPGSNPHLLTQRNRQQMSGGYYGDSLPTHRVRRSASKEPGKTKYLSRKKRFANMIQDYGVMGGMGMGGMGMRGMMSPMMMGGMNPMMMSGLFGGEAEGGMGMGMMNPMSIMMGTARDPNTGKKIDAGDFFKNSMRNNFHFAMTGRFLPPGKDGGDFVKNMAPLWHFQRMRQMREAMRPKPHPALVAAAKRRAAYLSHPSFQTLRKVLKTTKGANATAPAARWYGEAPPKRGRRSVVN